MNIYWGIRRFTSGIPYLSLTVPPTKTPLYGQVTHEKLVKAEPPKKGVNLIVGIWAEKIKPIYI